MALRPFKSWKTSFLCNVSPARRTYCERRDVFFKVLHSKSLYLEVESHLFV